MRTCRVHLRINLDYHNRGWILNFFIPSRSLLSLPNIQCESLSIYIYIFCIYFITTPHTHAQHNADKKTTCDTKQNKKHKKKTFVNTFFQNRQRPFYSELFNSYSSERLFIHRYTINGHLAEFNIWVRHSSFLPSLQSTIRAQKSANNMAVAIQRRGSGAMIDEERRKYKLSV